MTAVKTWTETSRREIEPAIHVDTRLKYAARRWIVAEVCRQKGQIIEFRERIEVGKTLYAHEVSNFIENLIVTTNSMNEMLKGVLQEKCPSTLEEEAKAKIPHIDRIAKTLG